MIFINDLLDLKDGREIYLNINGKNIPMGLDFYVADDMFFFKIDETKEKVCMLEDLKYALETEADDECWHGDIYTAPMEKIGACELCFPRDFEQVITYDIFDNNYTITHIDTTVDKITIYLK